MLRTSLSRALAFTVLVVSTGCSSSDATKNPGPPQKADAGTGATKTPDAYNKDCSSANWAGVSDACWSCLCGTCKDTLNVCDTDCTGVFKCAAKNQTLVNVGGDVLCEERATLAACVAGNTSGQAGAAPLITMDTCLITAPTKPAGQLRACATECGITYPGDVCQRYPDTSGKDGG